MSRSQRWVAGLWLIIGLALVALPQAVHAGEKAPSEGAKELVEEPGDLEATIEYMAKGGRTMLALLALSVVGLAVLLERVVHVRRSRFLAREALDGLSRVRGQGDLDAHRRTFSERRSVLDRMALTLLDHWPRGEAQASQAAGDLASRELRTHLQRAYPLAVVGTLSPLVGLLGTVFGMIESFEMVALAGSLGDATLLADGISKALVTTAVGLIIAVPALALYHFYKVRIQGFGILLEEETSRLIKALSSGEEA